MCTIQWHMFICFSHICIVGIMTCLSSLTKTKLILCIVILGVNSSCFFFNCSIWHSIVTWVKDTLILGIVKWSYEQKPCVWSHIHCQESVFWLHCQLVCNHNKVIEQLLFTVELACWSVFVYVTSWSNC